MRCVDARRPACRRRPLSAAVAQTHRLQVSRIPFPPPAVHAMPTPVTTMAFDVSQELLWTGNDYVSSAALHSPRVAGLTRCTGPRHLVHGI